MRVIQVFEISTFRTASVEEVDNLSGSEIERSDCTGDVIEPPSQARNAPFIAWEAESYGQDKNSIRFHGRSIE